MTISIGYHFTEIPEITHRDFPVSDTRHSAFTAVTLTDEAGVEHHMYLPLGARITVSKGQSHE